MGRVDHNLNSADRLFVTGYWNKRQEDRYNWAQDAANATDDGVINGFAVTKGFDYRTNTGVTGGYTSALSSRDAARHARQLVALRRVPRSGAGRSIRRRSGSRPTALQLMHGLPLPAALHLRQLQHDQRELDDLVARLAALRLGRRLQPADGHVLGGADADQDLGDAHARAPATTCALQRWNIISDGFPGGRFQFNGAYTRASNSAATNDRAQSWAQFLLGLPTAATGTVATPGTSSSQFEIASPGEFSQMYHGLFVQDDWRVNRRLTVNLGLRLEINRGCPKRENRNLARLRHDRRRTRSRRRRRPATR